MPKPSPDRIRAVLEELYALDPSLRAHGAALEKAVATLLAARPDVRINPQFAAKLRTQLAKAPVAPAAPSSFMDKLSLRVWLPTAAAATAVVVIAVVVAQPHLLGLSRTPQEQVQTDGLIPSSGLSISRIDGRAYGELFASAAGGLGGNPSAISARPQSGGGGGGMSLPMYAVAEDAARQDDSLKFIAPAPESYIYERPRYTYNGELPTLAATSDVYRRIKKPITGLGGSLTNSNLGFLDLGRFGNTQLTQFSVTQAGPYGYQMYVDLNEGTVNINQDWMSWPQPAATGYEPFAATDVPDDTRLIAIADAFLKDHGIATDSYAAPIVDRRWSVVQPYMRGTEAVTEDLKIRWAPDTITVMYPLQLNGMMAYDQSGFPYGLSVSVNMREGRVSSVWNLTTLSYEASSYDLVTDTQQILDIASRGDQYAGPFGQDPNETIRDFSLGTPTLVLMQTWHATSDGRGEELLVPALRFPVTPDAEGNTGYREAVMVPLVKDLVEPVYQLMRDGMGGASATPPPATMPEPVVDAPVQR